MHAPALLLVAAALAVAGCGGDEAADHGEPLTTPTHAPGQTETAP
jgi:ABC-type glycerol-3-phosphate transport system substrate-binding protein